MSIVPRKKLFRIAGLAALGLAFSLVACDDSSSAKAEDAPELSSGTVQESSSSDAPESSSGTVLESSSSHELDSAYCDSVTRKEVPYTCGDSLGTDGIYYRESGFLRQEATGCTYKCQNNMWSFVPAKDIPDTATVVSDYDRLSESEFARKLNFKKCNAENEGEVRTGWSGINPKYGSEVFYRCEQGTWVDREASVKCDTAGVAIGAICRAEINATSIGVGVVYTRAYTYEGAGNWNLLLETSNTGRRLNIGGLSQMEEKCSPENEGAKAHLVYGIEPDVIGFYYMCSEGEWTEIDETNYRCTTVNTAVGDTCSYESGDSTLHFLFMYVIDYQDFWHENTWVESTIDPEFGYCPHTFTDPTELTYIQKDGKFYYCDFGKWVTAGFVPHQETDPRKEGLTDEEYDVLDLPKEATVGDRVGGLLENCFDNVRVDLGGPDEWYSETYDYCLSKNYYRYRENGTWTLETEEVKDSVKYRWPPECTPESEGMEYSYLPQSRDPGKIYKRIGVRPATIVTSLNTIEETFYCDDSLVAYIFGRSEKK